MIVRTGMLQLLLEIGANFKEVKDFKLPLKDGGSFVTSLMPLHLTAWRGDEAGVTFIIEEVQVSRYQLTRQPDHRHLRH